MTITYVQDKAQTFASRTASASDLAERAVVALRNGDLARARDALDASRHFLQSLDTHCRMAIDAVNDELRKKASGS